METITIIGTFIVMCGIILIYDAREITKKRFSFGDQNNGVRIMKILGFVMAIVGGLLILI